MLLKLDTLTEFSISLCMYVSVYIFYLSLRFYIRTSDRSNHEANTFTVLYEHYFLLYRQVNSIHVLVMQLYIQLHNAFVWNKQLLKTNGLFGYCYFWHFYSKYRQCLSISITLNCFMYFNLENLHCIVVYKLWQIALMHVYITVLRIFLKRFIQSFWP